jgi:hypothetical protein
MSSWATRCTMAALLSTLGVCSGHAQAPAQRQIDQALRMVKERCLSGKPYDLYADAKGNIVIKKLPPGGEGSATMSKREAEGAKALYAEPLRLIADLQARECIKASIPAVLKLPKRPSSPGAGANISTSKRIDLSGLWRASGYVCQEGVPVPEEKVRMQQMGNVVTATKEKGDACIRSGEVTFTGAYDGTKTTIPVEMHMRRPNASTYPLRVPALLEIVDSDSLVLVYSGIKITFARDK